MAKVSRPVVYTAVLAVVAYGVVVLTEPETPTGKARAKAVRPKAEAKAGLFTEEDRTAKFTPLGQTTRNGFRPLVIREGAGGSLDASRSDGVPAAFAGGDPNWRYTGMAEVNGVKQALLENASNGDAVFLRVGESWKQTMLRAIASDSIELVGPNGTVRTITLGVAEEAAPATPGTAPLAVNPPANLRGAIGGGVAGVNPGALSVDPIGAAAAGMAPGMGINGMGTGGGRRNRRDRGN